MDANLARFAVVLGLAAVFVIAARWITWEQMDMSATRCPAGRGEANARAAIAAYEAIAEDLARGNTDDVGRRATVIATFFAPMNDEIAGSARRLAAARNLAAARREFARLARLFTPAAPIAQSTPPRA
jgi:hypothetical protein